MPIPAAVIERDHTCAGFDEATGAVQVDREPKYWFSGEELATRLKPMTIAAQP